MINQHKSECGKRAKSSLSQQTFAISVAILFSHHYTAQHFTLLLLLLHPLNGTVSTTTWISQYPKDKTSLDLNEARDDGVWGCSGISWNTSKQSAPRSRQTTTPTFHHSICRGRMLFLTPNQQH